jgi:hypothetical protein
MAMEPSNITRGKAYEGVYRKMWGTTPKHYLIKNKKVQFPLIPHRSFSSVKRVTKLAEMELFSEAMLRRLILCLK